MDKLLHQIMQTIDCWNAQQWALVLLGVIVVGVFCLRSHGSRSQY